MKNTTLTLNTKPTIRMTITIQDMMSINECLRMKNPQEGPIMMMATLQEYTPMKLMLLPYKELMIMNKLTMDRLNTMKSNNNNRPSQKLNTNMMNRNKFQKPKTNKKRRKQSLDEMMA